MKEQLMELVNKEVESEVKSIGSMELGADEHVKTAKVANDMMDRLIKVDEIENEKRKLDLEERKLDIEEQKVENDKRNNKIKNVLSGIAFVTSLGVTIWANIDSKRFELGSTHTTEAGRGSTRKLLNLLDKFK